MNTPQAATSRIEQQEALAQSRIEECKKHVNNYTREGVFLITDENRLEIALNALQEVKHVNEETEKAYDFLQDKYLKRKGGVYVQSGMEITVRMATQQERDRIERERSSTDAHHNGSTLHNSLSLEDGYVSRAEATEAEHARYIQRLQAERRRALFSQASKSKQSVKQDPPFEWMKGEEERIKAQREYYLQEDQQKESVGVEMSEALAEDDAPNSQNTEDTQLTITEIRSMLFENTNAFIQNPAVRPVGLVSSIATHLSESDISQNIRKELSEYVRLLRSSAQKNIERDEQVNKDQSKSDTKKEAMKQHQIRRIDTETFVKTTANEVLKGAHYHLKWICGND